LFTLVYTVSILSPLLDTRRQSLIPTTHIQEPCTPASSSPSHLTFSRVSPSVDTDSNIKMQPIFIATYAPSYSLLFVRMYTITSDVFNARTLRKIIFTQKEEYAIEKCRLYSSYTDNKVMMMKRHAYELLLKKFITIYDRD